MQESTLYFQEGLHHWYSKAVLWSSSKDFVKDPSWAPSRLLEFESVGCGNSSPYTDHSQCIYDFHLYRKFCGYSNIPLRSFPSSQIAAQWFSLSWGQGMRYDEFMSNSSLDTWSWIRLDADDVHLSLRIGLLICSLGLVWASPAMIQRSFSVHFARCQRYPRSLCRIHACSGCNISYLRRDRQSLWLKW